MPRRMAYCPSPLLLRSTVTPDMRWMTLATVMSGDSSMAFALITFTTFIDCRSMARAPASDRPGLWAMTVTPSSSTSSSARRMDTSPVPRPTATSTILYPT